MKIRLYLTVECNKERKDLSCLVETGKNIREDLSSELKSAFPDSSLPASGSLLLTIDGDNINLQSSGRLIINGVSVRSRKLKTRDRIIFGQIRIFYNSFSLFEPEPLPVNKTSANSLLTGIYTRLGRLAADCSVGISKIHETGSGILTHPFRAAGISGTIVAAFIIAGCLAIPHHSNPTDRTQKSSELTATQTVPLPEPERHEGASSKPQIPEEDESVKSVLVIPPGGTIPDFDLDILFIHAHPDDESLDFGCLLALCEAAGLKTGLVTLTDGESGLDLYPDRLVSGIYPDHDMEGTELAAVRALELRRAAGTLGVDLLIRLGRKNNPYNSIKDELSPDEIIRLWGGKDELAGVLKQIILKTRPETVVAPEGPGKAREHFEHEAVGYITSEVMAGFTPDDYKSPKRFLTCIDPRQHHLYPEASMIDAGIRVDYYDNERHTLRDIQLRALLNHRTQNDAVNVGTGFLPKYPAEYYKIQYWRSNRSWEDLLESGLY